MKCEKINNYKLTGSIHTLQIKSMDIPDVPPQLQECISSSSTKKSNGKIEAISIINPNKLIGDCHSFTEFEDCFSSILEECRSRKNKTIVLAKGWKNYSIYKYS